MFRPTYVMALVALLATTACADPPLTNPGSDTTPDTVGAETSGDQGGTDTVDGGAEVAPEVQAETTTPDDGPEVAPEVVQDVPTDGPADVPGDTPTDGPGDVPPNDDGTTGCSPAQVEIIALDIWAQALADADVDAGAAGSGTGTLQIDLCESVALAATVTAEAHYAWTADLDYDGTAGVNGLAVTMTTADAAHGGYYATTEIADVGGVATRVYKVYTGIAHRWFASSGRPARRGTDVTLLIDGEEAWGAVREAVLDANDLITASSWWWDSEFELVRDWDTHIGLSEADRWDNTALGSLELKSGVERKVMVGQFLSQDGFVDWVNIDDELTAHAETADDMFEFMGHANTSKGVFMVTPPAVDFGETVETQWPDVINAGPLGEAGVPAFMAPVEVDMTDFPVFELTVAIASWHQKFWTMDQQVAFVGGMNATVNDWDGSGHEVFDYRRMDFDASESARQDVFDREELPDRGPRKDYMVRLEGEIVADVVDVFDLRWEWLRAEGVSYSENASSIPLAATPAPIPNGVQAQLVATMPEPFAEYSILESLLKAISQAEHYIFIEDQYFRAPILADAIIERMQEVPDLILIAVTNPVNEWTDPGCWQTYIQDEKFKTQFPDRYRAYTLKAFDYQDSGCTFCIWETDGFFEDINIHSKLFIADDSYLEVGSCNHNNRGLLYEGELAVVVYDTDWVTGQRQEIFQNMFGGEWPVGLAYDEWIAEFDAAAAVNDAAEEEWDTLLDAGLDLDGDPLPPEYMPGPTFLYTAPFREPNECFLKGVGEDVT